MLCNDQLVYKVVIWAFFGISLWTGKVALTYPICILGEGTSILGHGREVLLWWSPIFEILQSNSDNQINFMTHHNLIDPPFCRKKSVYLYHLYALNSLVITGTNGANMQTALLTVL